jgi:hypothetical protein
MLAKQVVLLPSGNRKPDIGVTRLVNQGVVDLNMIRLKTVAAVLRKIRSVIGMDPAEASVLLPSAPLDIPRNDVRVYARPAHRLETHEALPELSRESIQPAHGSFVRHQLHTE